MFTTVVAPGKHLGSPCTQSHHDDLGPEFRGAALRRGPRVRLAEAQLRRSGFEERCDDGPRRPAGAKDRRRTALRIPARGVLAEVGQEAIAIGIVGVNPAIFVEDQGVGRTDQRGAIGDEIGQVQRGFLVGDGDVNADETPCAAAGAATLSPRSSCDDIERARNVPSYSMGFSASTRAGVGDKRMGDGQPDHPGKWYPVGHVSITPLADKMIQQRQ